MSRIRWRKSMPRRLKWAFIRVERKTLKQELRERNGDRCYWCRMPMDFSLDANTAMSPTIEHMKRKRDGGGNEIQNLRLAHKACNQARETTWRMTA